MEKPKAFCISFFDEKQIWNYKTMIYDQKEMDAFLEEQANKLEEAAKTHACITGLYAEQVAAALRGKAKEK